MLNSITFLLISSIGWSQTSNNLAEFGFKGFDRNVAAECKIKASATHVSIFKQWHLSPNENTRTSDVAELPQAENQIWIYSRISEAATAGLVNAVVVEGCSGEIDGKFTKSFNDWTLTDLKAAVSKPKFPAIMTHIGLKLKAKFDAKIKVLCGDDDKLIEESNLVLSDLRGYVGFATRIIESKNNPERLMGYVSAAANTLKLSTTASTKVVGAELVKRAEASVKRFKELIEARNDKFLAAIASLKDQRLAVVVGGLHAPGLVKRLDDSKFACTVFQPDGYLDANDKIISTFEVAIRNWHF